MYPSLCVLLISYFPFAFCLTVQRSLSFSATVSSEKPWGNQSLTDSQQALTTIDQIFQEYNLTHNELGATVISLLYGTPLVAYNKEFRGSKGLSQLGTNKLFSSGTLSDPSETSVVLPNVDTIYALAAIDLSSTDLVLTVPPIQPNRYYLFAFYDPYGDNYASIGSVNASKPGNYLFRPSLQTGHSGFSASCTKYNGCFGVPTIDGTLLLRVEVKENNTADLDDVNRYLDQVKLTSTNNHTNKYAPLQPSDLTNLSPMIPEQALQLTARLYARNPPEIPEFASAIEPVLRLAGINPETGVYATPPGVNLTQASSIFNATLAQWNRNSSNEVPLTNGWTTYSPYLTGTYKNGTDIVSRSQVSLTAYLANSPDEAVYPKAPQTTYQLQEEEAYLVSFVGGRPPITSVGFWSLTMYDAQGYLIPNPQSTYALGDRSNLTYSDGSLVYSSGSNSDDNSGSSDTSFQLLVQSANVEPPKNWTANWLAAPSNGTSFQLILRMYAPTSNVVYDFDGGYLYPTFEKVPAITA